MTQTPFLKTNFASQPLVLLQSSLSFSNHLAFKSVHLCFLFISSIESINFILWTLQVTLSMTLSLNSLLACLTVNMQIGSFSEV